MLSFNHGSVSSCVGPILDVSLNHNLFCQERYTIEYFNLEMFLPSVYDSLLVLKSSSHLRDGTVVRCLYINEYLTSIPFNDSYLFSFLHLMPVNYSLFTALWAISSLFSSSLILMRQDYLLFYLALGHYNITFQWIR